ncbi:acylphosphatase-2 isoform X3 [Canis lupus baileyi]|uniref:acylphosphatase-2 isoform X3 n=1 Tax=Canis lupus baileyi TaxID=143281 RepID=UPI003B97A4A7
MRARPPPAAAAAAAAACRAPLRLLRTGLAAAMSAARPLKSVDYEVFGRVQGVCFRMYTEDEAKKIGVVGWVKNTSKGTVTGQVQGPEDKVNSIEFQCAARAENYPSCVAFNDEKTQDFQTLLKVIQQVQDVLAEQGWKSQFSHRPHELF